MKLVSLNIEHTKHLETVLPFLERENADVLCIQELVDATIQEIARFGYTYSFLPMTHVNENGRTGTLGTALFVRNGIAAHFHSWYYRGGKGTAPGFNRSLMEETVWRGVVYATCAVDGRSYQIGSTHFTWTEYGESASELQKNDMHTLLTRSADEPPHILCGDFNIPRHHNALYEELTGRYTDNVPEHYASSLDKTLHRLGSTAGKEHLFTSFMVDYLFSQAPYTVSDVRLVFGVSDHAAVVGNIS